MAITYLQAKQALASYAGRGGICYHSSAPEVDLFVRQVLEYCLFAKQFGSLRKYCFVAQDSCITVPYEVESILKVKIDDVVGTAHNRWFEFYDTSILDNCIPAENALFEDPNYYPTVYDPPSTGARVGIMGTCPEATDAYVIFQGVDTSGRQILTKDKRGNYITGEAVDITLNSLLYTKSNFAKVTSIIKPITKGYVTVYWTIPDDMSKGFMADLSPLDQRPEFKRYRLTAKCSPVSKVSVLANIRLKPAYTDIDLIPFDSQLILHLAGQLVQATTGPDIKLASDRDEFTTRLINREAGHKVPNVGSPVEVFKPTSGGSIRSLHGSMRRWGMH